MTWTSFNAFSGTITSFGGVTMNGTVEIAPLQTTTYTGIFTGNNGAQVSCQAIVQVTTPTPIAYVNPPVLNDNVPYVTLQEVPYTGLDLGPVGTALYWGLLGLWCAMMAYFIVVKRLHYKMALKLNEMFFGESEEGVEVETETPASDEPMTPAVAVASAPVTKAEHADLMDDFITSQIFKAI
jgi:hypothetical protein